MNHLKADEVVTLMANLNIKQQSGHKAESPHYVVLIKSDICGPVVDMNVLLREAQSRGPMGSEISSKVNLN